MSSSNFPCYNCKFSNTENALFCESCNIIQPPVINDHFAKFALMHNYLINLDELDEKYLGLQKKLHPDQFSNKSDIEKALALKHSISINEAYETLKHPLKRSEYLLKIHGIIVNQDNRESKSPNPILLQEIMEIRMELEDIETYAPLQDMQQTNQKNIDATIAEIAQSFSTEKFDLAAEQSIKLRYLEKISEEIEVKLSLMEHAAN